MPFAAPRITLAFSQRRNGSDDVKLMMVLWPTCDTSPSAIRPAGASPAAVTSAGIPPGHDDDAGSVWRILITRRRTSSIPNWSTTHFIRARNLLSRLPVCSNTRNAASTVGNKSSRDVKSSSASAGCGFAPNPPAMYTRNPDSIEPSSRVRVAATTPTSLNIA